MGQGSISAERIPLFDRLVFALFVLVVPALLGGAAANFADGDVSWHLAAGRWILDHRQIPRVDPFSFTFAGQPWVAFEWLAEVIYASAFAGAGYAGVAAVMVLALMALHAIVFVFLAKRVGPIAVAIAFVAMDALLIPFILARPHLLVWPILAAWTALLIDRRDKARAPPLALALLMALWANLHGSFMLGFVIAGALALDAMIASRWDKKLLLGWLSFALAALIAALVNANGLAGFLYPLTVMGFDNLALIEEWRPSSPSTTPMFHAVLAATIAAIIIRRARLGWGELLLLVMLTAMALMQVRHQGWLAIVAPLILAPRLAPGGREGAAPMFASHKDRRLWLGAAALAALVLLAARLALPIRPAEDVANPTGLVAHIPDELRSKPVLNQYSFGGPLILAGIKPYIDGRAEMYGDAFFADYARIARGDRARFDAAVERYGIAWTVFPPGSPVVKALDSSPGWRRVYADRVGVIHVRRGAAPLKDRD